MKVNYKKILINTAIFTVSALIVVSLIIFGLMYFVFTAELANFYYSLGWNKSASNLYYKVYEKNNDIIYCYKALNIKINIDDDNGIVKVYQEFINDDEYNSFITNIEKNNKSLSIGVLEQSAILNERNYLAGKYVESLVDIGEINKAYDESVKYFDTCKNFTLNNQGIYCFNTVINSQMNEEMISKFYKITEGSSNSLIVELQDYFNKAVETFNNETATSDLSKAYLVALGNRIIIVGNNINTIYTLKETNTDLVTSNNDKMGNINTAIKNLLNKG